MGQFYFEQIMYTLIAYMHKLLFFFYWSAPAVHLNFAPVPQHQSPKVDAYEFCSLSCKTHLCLVT